MSTFLPFPDFGVVSCGLVSLFAFEAVAKNSMRTTYVKPKVLLVDDDHVFLHVYTTILQQHFDTQAAQGPEAALALLAEGGSYGVVVTDLNMPELNGLDFLRQVTRLSPGTKKILFTGKPDLDSALAAINQARIFGYLGKDAPPEDLVEKIREAMHEFKREQQREHLRGDSATRREQVLTAEEKSFFARSANDD